MSRSRIKRKQAKCLDASGVKAIADMQGYITELENYLWRMAMYIEGRDDVGMIIEFTDGATRYATKKIYNFINEHKEEKDAV